MVARDETGKFVKGNGGGPGRPSKVREEKYREILLTTVTYQDWQEIITKAARQAKSGDAVARKWLSDYLVGTPIQRIGNAPGEKFETTTNIDDAVTSKLLPELAAGNKENAPE